MLTRRLVLAAAAATAAARALPTGLAPAAEQPPVAPQPARWYIVGLQDDDWGWDMIRASDEAAARVDYLLTHCGSVDCEGDGTEDCDCHVCYVARSIDAYHEPRLDGREATGPADWLRLGMSACCARCDDSTCGEEDGGQVVGETVVCADCMTIEDWDIADPARAAELRQGEARHG